MSDLIQLMQDDEEQLQMVNDTYQPIREKTKTLWQKHNPSDFAQLEAARENLIQIYSGLYSKNDTFVKVLKQLDDAFVATTLQAHKMTLDEHWQLKYDGFDVPPTLKNKTEYINQTGEFFKLPNQDGFIQLIKALGVGQAGNTPVTAKLQWETYENITKI